MITLSLLLFILAAICFLLASFGVGFSRVNLVALGLFFGTVGFILGGR